MKEEAESRRLRLGKEFFQNWRVLAAGMLIALTILLVTGFSYFHKTVTIRVDGKRITIGTVQQTVGQVLKEANVELNPLDMVEPAQNTALSEGMRIRVKRAVPVTIVSGDQEIYWITREEKVEDVLQEANIDLSPWDRVEQKLKAPVAEGMVITLHRVTHKIETAEVILPYETKRIFDDRLEKGITRILQKGKNGKIKQTIKVIYEDGKEIGREILDKEILVEAVPEVISVGTKSFVYRGGKTVHFVKALEMVATAYYPGPESCGVWADGYTYLGMKATKGVVAVDPRVIPLRTRLYVEGYGYAVAGDIGGAIKGNKIDLCFDTYKEARRYGRKVVKVYILD